MAETKRKRPPVARGTERIDGRKGCLEGLPPFVSARPPAELKRAASQGTVGQRPGHQNGESVSYPTIAHAESAG